MTASTAGRVSLYDTTLRDGTQREGMSLSVDDKLRIARELDGAGRRLRRGRLARVQPQGRRVLPARVQAGPGTHANRGLRQHLPRRFQLRDDAEHPGPGCGGERRWSRWSGKSSALHVERVLETTRDENLQMISDSVAYLKALGKEVIYDAEHFFDGFRLDREYALASVRAAAAAGADCVVLCDTNGGSLPEAVADAVRAVRDYLAAAGLPAGIGIHTHNDAGLAVANALAAVQAGATHVQGTINGYGERCGNLDLVPLIANLQLKLGYQCLSSEQLRRLTEVSHLVADIANLNPDAHAPYVGRSAFAHKGGIHAAAVHKFRGSYEHVEPALVGNETRVVVSELAGRRNVHMRAEALGLQLDGRERAVLEHIKELERGGFQFEAAEGSFEMLVRRSAPDYQPPFELLDYTAIVGKQGNAVPCAQVMVRVRVGDVVLHTAADAEGPVQALDRAIRKALVPRYPGLSEVHLVDYKVRIIDAHMGTAARPRVLIESARGEERWSTVGCSCNIIEASWQALRDSLELPILRDRDARPAPRPAAPASTTRPAVPASTARPAPRHSFLHLWGP